MIPALLAMPLVEGVVGGVVDGVMHSFTPSVPTASPFSGSAFNPLLNQASSALAAAQPSPVAASAGSIRSDEWSQMSAADVKSWMNSLTGKHVVATDETGRTISGLVSGMQQIGNTMALNVGGHLVSLSQLKQVSWSPSV